MNEIYCSLKNRNIRAKELKGQGYKVVRRTTGPCQLHPEYIKDWPRAYDTGFGNTDYLMTHGNLYVVEWRDL